jgi:hypothetical protein
MILDEFPGDLKPVVQPIDTWFENRRLALIFEAKSGGGKILVCSINMKNLETRTVSKQLYNSLLNYMNGNEFMPRTEVDLKTIRNLIK